MSTTYASRPVFDFRVNWKDNPEPSFSYDLREVGNDWGPLGYAMLQRHVARGWRFHLNLNSIAEVIAFETFCNTTKGRLNGFWFPAPDNLAIVVSGSGSELVIEEQGLAASWDAGVPLHVWISRRATDTPVPALVTNVAAGDPGEEVVTLDTTLADPIDATWRVSRLLYARFATDDEEWSWLEEGRQVRTLRVVELTREYAAAETGALDVYLYRFGYAPPGGGLEPLKEWFYTSFQADIASTYGGTIASQAHTSIPINHGALRFSAENPAIETTLADILYDTTGPWARSQRTGHPPLWVRIYRASYAAPNTTTLVYTGEVLKWKAKGKKLTAPCIGGVDAGTLRLPLSKRGSVCRAQVFDANLCKKSETGFKVTATVSAISGLSVTLDAAGFSGKAANYYAQGKIETGSGKTLRYGTALRSTAESGGSITVLLSRSIGLAVSDTVYIWPGCDGLKETCQTKFDNYVNFEGHPLVPLKNSTTDLLAGNNIAPNKK